MQLLDGKATALEIRQELAAAVKQRKIEGKKIPHLAAILVGNDGGSVTYVNESDAVIAVVSAKRSAVSLSQEFGNANTPMHAFLRPALDSNSEEVVRILKTELAQVIPAYVAKMNKGKKK
jgi:hypothetical protein